jgi:hypothetical protein
MKKIKNIAMVVVIVMLVYFVALGFAESPAELGITTYQHDGQSTTTWFD